MKKLKILLLAFLFLPFAAQAVTVSDLPAINDISIRLVQDAQALKDFAFYVQNLVNNNWQQTVAGSTYTLTLSNTDKQALLAIYTSLKAQMVADYNQLP